MVVFIFDDKMYCKECVKDEKINFFMVYNVQYFINEQVYMN